MHATGWPDQHRNEAGWQENSQKRQKHLAPFDNYDIPYVCFLGEGRWHRSRLNLQSEPAGNGPLEPTGGSHCFQDVDRAGVDQNHVTVRCMQ